MPDITKADIGRRMYQLQKEKGVERVLDKIRESLGPDWKIFSDTEIRMLERLLAEAWAAFDRTSWDKIPFGRMNRADVERILDIGKFLDIEKAPKTQIKEELERVLLAGI